MRGLSRTDRVIPVLTPTVAGGVTAYNWLNVSEGGEVYWSSSTGSEEILGIKRSGTGVSEVPNANPNLVSPSLYGNDLGKARLGGLFSQTVWVATAVRVDGETIIGTNYSIPNGVDLISFVSYNLPITGTSPVETATVYLIKA